MFLLFNTTCFLLLSIFGGYVFLFRKSFFLGLFALSYALLFCFVPLCNFYLNGYYVYHPEAVYGPIADQSLFEIYSLINLHFSFLILIFIAPFIFIRKQTVCVDASGLSLFRHISAVMVVVGFFVYLYSLGFKGFNPVSLALEAYSSGRMAHFKNPGYSPLLMNISLYLMSFSSVFFYISFRKEYRYSFLSFIVLLVVVAFTFIAGGRQALMLFVSGLFAALYFGRASSSFGIFVVAVVSGCILVLLQFFRARTGEQLDLDVILRLLTVGDLSYFFYASLEAIRQFEYYDVGFVGSFYRNLLLIFMPTDWTFGIKVRDLSSLFAFAFESGVDFRSGNYPPGLIGLFVLNFGWFGFFLVGSFLLFVGVFIERFINNGLVLVVFYANILFWVLQIMRGTLMGYYIFMFQLIVLCLFLLSKKLVSYRNKVLIK